MLLGATASHVELARLTSKGVGILVTSVTGVQICVPVTRVIGTVGLHLRARIDTQVQAVNLVILPVYMIEV